MLKLIRSEIYRLLHKKSLYMTNAVLMVIFGAILYFAMTEAGRDDMSMMLIGNSLLPITPYIFGAIWFIAVYTDDFGSKSLSNIVAAGYPKWMIVVSKFIVFVLFVIFQYIILGIFYALIWLLVVGHLPNLPAEGFNMLINTTIVCMILTIGFGVLASLVGYLSQKTVYGVMIYFLAGFGLFAQIVNLLSNMFDWLKPVFDNMLYTQVGNNFGLVMSNKPIDNQLWIVAGLYIVVSMILSTLALENNEIEV